MPRRRKRPDVDKVSPQFVLTLLGKLRSGSITGLEGNEIDSLSSILETWVHINDLAERKGASIVDVRRALDKVAQSSTSRRARGGGESDAPTQVPDQAEPAETSAPVEPTPDEPRPSDDGERGTRHEHGRRHVDALGDVVEAHHHHTLLSEGCQCPDCLRGRLYGHKPSKFTSIGGQPSLVATRHIVETLRCNLCKAVFKAPLPERFEADGVSGRTLYSYSAVAVVCIHRCFGGMPMHRQETIQSMLGVRVPDASMWDMHERLADALRPIRRLLVEKAADARQFYGDDTNATILTQRRVTKANRKTGKKTERTGCHATGVIAVLDDGARIVLFATGIHHTGEVMDKLLLERDDALEPPVFMGDCIESNTVTTAVVLYAGCNAHAVRRFKEIVDKYPDEAGYALCRFKEIYENEKHCREAGLDAVQRRDYHRTHSRPLLREITDFGEDRFEQRKMEPNSDIGEAFDYVINNERRLSAFARHPYAPLDNNQLEQTLRIVVRLRETSHFYRNLTGSSVADTILTVGATALAAKVNLYDYFVAVQRHAKDVRADPEDWLPWKFKDPPATPAAHDDPPSGADPIGPPTATSPPS